MWVSSVGTHCLYNQGWRKKAASKQAASSHPGNWWQDLSPHTDVPCHPSPQNSHHATGFAPALHAEHGQPPPGQGVSLRDEKCRGCFPCVKPPQAREGGAASYLPADAGNRTVSLFLRSRV